MRLKCVTLTTSEGVFIFNISGQEYVCIGVGFINQGLKSPLLSYRVITFRYWWKMQFTFPRVGFQYMEGMLHICGAVPDARSKLAVGRPRGALAYPHQIFSTKIQTPKDNSSFALASLTNRSHQVSSRILLGPCFVSCV